MNALNIAFIAYLPILIAGLVAIIVCLVARRRYWSRWQCILSLAVTGLLLLLLTGLFLQGAVATGGYHGEAGMAGSILFMAWIPIAVEFVALLALARRIGLPRKEAARAEKRARPGEVSDAADGGVNL